MDRQIRYSDGELEIIKNTFADNLPLLKTMRKVMLQLPFSEAEEMSFHKALNPEVMKVVRKSFLPEIDGNAPLNQVVDLWATVQVLDKLPDIALLHLKARELLIKYLGEQLNILAGVSKVKTMLFQNFTVLGNSEEEAFTNIVARNNILTHTEHQLTELFILAGSKKETKDEMFKRIKVDSSK